MIYLFQHPETEEVIEVVQSAHEEHKYVDNQGVKWNRLFTIPYTASNTKADPFNSRDFSKKFDGKNVTIGDMSDESAALSAAREQRAGIDPVKTKFFDDYKSKRKGINHPDDPRPKEAARKKIESHLNKTLKMPTS